MVCGFAHDGRSYMLATVMNILHCILQLKTEYCSTTSWAGCCGPRMFGGQLVTGAVHVHTSQCWQPRIVQLKLHSTELGRRRTLVSRPLIIDTRRRPRLEYRQGRRHVLAKISNDREIIPFSHFTLLVCTLQNWGFSFAVARGRVN